jgi:hypothetical protein
VNKPTVALVVTVVGGVIVALIVALLHIGGSSGSSHVGSGSAASYGATGSTATTIPAGSASSPVTGQSSVANGTQLGAYTFELPQAHGTPLGPTKPTLSQFIDLGPGDILYDGNITPGNGDQLLELPGGSTPTYQSCTNNTLVENSAPATAGTAFCVVETGRIAGVTVSSVGTTQPYDYYIALNVTVWQNS